ncbi:phage tail domain-containing protein [Pediococcus acidilactici]|uniref:phage tail domain-containing protein n=2 Tax=Pediococcus acidilactici TaxID=1254 RepID=UPI001330DC36|nr:phage tail domain-containing protein [Pediococcus acidilactici]KAF0339779.1 hypothetical protein GBO40_04385 [Pediococcus acidilactici]KAF0462261.1 hypothetical protein GBP00_02605 [Pediococcus acidilactici]
MAKELPLAKHSFEFDGIRAYEDLGLVVGHINWPTGTTITHSSQSVPGRYGGIPQGNAYGAKVWQIPISFQTSSDEEHMETLINITRAFTRRAEQGVSFPMRFGTMPDVTYYGTFTSLPEASQISVGTNDSQLTLTFTADDPKGYKDPVTVKITDSMFEYTPEGTGEIYPIFRITPKKDMEEIGVAYGSDPTKYVDVGYDQVADEEGNTIVDKEPVLVSDPCNGLTTWTNITDISQINFGIDGEIDGSVMSNDTSISVRRSPNNTSAMYDYGDPLKHEDGRMYGPLIMHQGLPRAVKNFETTFRIHHAKNYSRAISGNEVYGIDSNGKCIFRAYLQDASQGRSTQGAIWIGPEGNDIQAYKGYKDYHNGKDYTNHVTIVKNRHVSSRKTRGGKHKGKTDVNYYQANVKIKNFNSTSYFNQGFIQCRIRKVGLKVWVSLWKCKNNGKTGDYILKNKVINLSKDQDFDFATIAWHAKKNNITEDKLNPKTGKVNKEYNYGWNSITSYFAKEILDDGNGDEPHPVVHAGETAVIDCERNETTLIHGGAVDPLEKRVSLGSTYPSLWGGQSEVIGFNVDPKEVDIEMTYRPTYL